MLPAYGFVNGLEFPTAADLVVLNIAKGFMPFGAAFMLGGYDLYAKHPKFVAHADLVANYPSVRLYLEASSTMTSDPFGLRMQQPSPQVTSDFTGASAQIGVTGRATTPLMISVYDRPPSSARNDDVAVSFEDLPSARLDMPVDQFNLENLENPTGNDTRNRTVWMCEPGDTTVHWRPTEQSLARESYNNIIQRNIYKLEGKPTEKFDVSEAMMKQTSMSRQAQLGSDWTPSGLLCRKIAAAAMDRPYLEAEPVNFYVGSSRASTPLDTPRTGSRRGSGQLMPRPPPCGQGPMPGSSRARRNLRSLGIVR
jgi:hypothetical protein